MTTPKIILMRESLAKSILSDVFSFGSCCAAIYVSRGDALWTAICAAAWLILCIGQACSYLKKQAAFREWSDLGIYAMQQAVIVGEIKEGAFNTAFRAEESK
jgi:hypothetical protein